MPETATEALQLGLFVSILTVKITEVFATPLWKWLKWPNEHKIYASLVVGLLITLAGGIDLVAPLGLKLAYPVGQIISGFLVSGGAGMIYDLWDTRFNPD